MALTDDEEELRQFGLKAVPSWVRPDDPTFAAAAKQIGAARRQADYWYSQTLIGQATGSDGVQPDWLNQHAKDRGTSRQANETDAGLRARLRTVEPALTVQSLIDAAQAILDAASIGGSALIVELPRDGAFSGTWGTRSGTGGTFSTINTYAAFTPTAGWGGQIVRDPAVVRTDLIGWIVTFSGAAHSGNNGTFGFNHAYGNAGAYINASLFAGADAGVSWVLQPTDGPNLLSAKPMAFASRGYRAGGLVRRIVMMLPAGSTAAIVAAVTEMLRNKKAAGIAVSIETP